MGHAHDRLVLARARERRASAPAAGHVLLSLQQTAGNGAVGQLVQREAAGATRKRKGDRYISSDVALAVTGKIYAGKCNAAFDGVTVRRTWEAGLLSNDITIRFVCGPQTFTFGTSVPWFGDRFPWDIQLATGSTAWLTDKVSKALDTINGNWDDEGGGFWEAVKTVKDALKHDIDRYCEE